VYNLNTYNLKYIHINASICIYVSIRTPSLQTAASLRAAAPGPAAAAPAAAAAVHVTMNRVSLAGCYSSAIPRIFGSVCDSAAIILE
jgi:hypothetical protein